MISQKSKLYKTFIKVDCNFFVRQSELSVLYSRGIKHTLGGDVALGSVILVGKVEHTLYSALNNRFGTLVAGKKSNVNGTAVQRSTGVVENCVELCVTNVRVLGITFTDRKSVV